MAVATEAQQKIRWEELEEDDGGDLDFLLPPRMVIGPDVKGLKNVIEYHFVDEGNKVKVTTTTRHCRPSPRSTTARRAWRSYRCPRSSCMERGPDPRFTVAPAVCRAAILAPLRSAKLGGAAIGLVITASHNPVRDKGVKIVDPNGGMLDQRWEPFADALATVGDPDALLQLLLQFAKDEGIPLGGGGPQVLLDRDTRPTGEYLLDVTL